MPQGLADNTIDFIEESPSAELVPQAGRLKLPKTKKSPRVKAERIQPVIKPTVAPEASASAAKPADSASWLVAWDLLKEDKEDVFFFFHLLVGSVVQGCQLRQQLHFARGFSLFLPDRYSWNIRHEQSLKAPHWPLPRSALLRPPHPPRPRQRLRWAPTCWAHRLAAPTPRWSRAFGSLRAPRRTKTRPRPRKRRKRRISAVSTVHLCPFRTYNVFSRSRLDITVCRNMLDYRAIY